jgi:hypothetical protein
MANYLASGAWLLPSLALLPGCPTVSLGDTPSELGQCNPKGGPDYFNQQIWPNYIVSNGGRSCIEAGCHDEKGGNVLKFTANPMDIENYRSAQAQLNCNTPEASPFLTKPLAGETSHGGGDIFTNDQAPPVDVFLAWFQ